MTIKEIIDGLKFTVEMFLFDPNTGGTYVEPRNDMDKTTIDACKGAIELLEQTRWIPVSKRLPEEKINPITEDFYEYQCTYHAYGVYDVRSYKFGNGHWWHGPGIMDDSVIAWMPLPKPYKAESEDKE